LKEYDNTAEGGGTVLMFIETNSEYCTSIDKQHDKTKDKNWES
jgi:hypothetical protein